MIKVKPLMALCRITSFNLLTPKAKLTRNDLFCFGLVMGGIDEVLTMNHRVMYIRIIV